MAETLPSNTSAIIDVPEVENLDAEFVYNFFTPDERQNRLGSLPQFINQTPSETFGSFYVNHTKSLPRLVKLSWQPITTGRRPDIALNVSIADNLRKIHSEETFTSDKFTTVHYQDGQSDQKYRFFALRSLKELENNRPTDQQSSPFDLSTVLNDSTPDQITAGFLADILSIDSTGKSHGIKFVQPNANAQFLDTSLRSLADVRVNVRVNNKVMTQILQTVRENSIGVFPDESQSDIITQQAQQIQNQAIANAHSAIINQNSFEFEVLDYLDIRPISTNGYTPVIQAVGYILEKTEYLNDGTTRSYDPIVIEDPFTAVTFDPQVRYGATYGYRIKSIFYVDIQAQDIETKQNVLVTFLVSSQISPEVQVTTEEFDPPPPPADFNLTWDYGEQVLRCTWNLPVNSQRDIKYLQLFRRKSIFEPFEMLRMWDFNDSLVNDPVTGFVIGYNETPDITLVEKSTNVPPRPTGFFLDREFTKDSRFIYAVAAIDAHGFSSPFSIQFEASFDRFANKLVKKLASHSGAPKPYPNAYLNQDTFVDTVKDSGHTKLLVVFNPDFITVRDAGQTDLRLLKTDSDNGRYRLQIINVDLQAQKVVDLFLQNKTIATPVFIRSGFSNIFAPQQGSSLNSGLR